VPAFAAWVAGNVPLEWEERFGEMVVAQAQAEFGQPITDPRVLGPVGRVVERLRAAEAGSPYTYRVIVVPRAEVNAMAAPGGTIVVFAGLLRLAEGPEAFAAVLGHEMEHVSRRHVLKGMLANASLGVLIEAMLGAGSSSAAGIARSLGQLSYSRGAEIEADDGAVRRLVAAKLDPRAMPEFLERMAAQGARGPAWASFLSTHPDPKDRGERLRRTIGAGAAGESGEAEPIVTAAEWRALKAALPAEKR
jgi:predicted Zn-dependent protease